MNWFTSLLFNDSVGRTVMIFAFVIAIGSMLGKLKLKGISLGSTFVLFVGILVSHFGFTVNASILHFMKDFGLILFVFSIGLQVGPNFFSSFKQSGLMLNGLAAGSVALNIAVTLLIFYLLGGIDFPMLVGVMQGAVTNTPGLGAAQQALNQLSTSGAGTPSISLGYAVAYPMGVVGIILGMVIIKHAFRIDYDKERAAATGGNTEEPSRCSYRITSKDVIGKQIKEISRMFNKEVVFARISQGGNVFVPNGDTVLNQGDLVRIIAPKQREAELDAMFGEKLTTEELNEQTGELKSRKILVTNKRLDGKSLQNLQLRKAFNVSVTRVFRSGVELMVTPELVLHMGDKVKVVGGDESLGLVEKFLGNSVKHLNEPHLSPLFIGIFLGIIVGYIPIAFPGMPQPAKLGLAGGPLIVSLLMGAFGHKIGLSCYTTQSANLMIREIGISLFLACVGLEAGEQFFNTLINGDGLLWVGYGLIITMVPMLIISTIARKCFKLNYFTIVGMISGTNTNPPALYYSNMIAENDRPSVAYSTVYPLAMFLRIVLAQTLILIFA